MEAPKSGEMEWDVIRTDVPSPFAHNLIVLGEPDVILMKEAPRSVRGGGSCSARACHSPALLCHPLDQP